MEFWEKASAYGGEHEFTVAVCSPSGQSVVIGSFDRYIVLIKIEIICHINND
jgi:C4-type Zn-finger protein